MLDLEPIFLQLQLILHSQGLQRLDQLALSLILQLDLSHTPVIELPISSLSGVDAVHAFHESLIFDTFAGFVVVFAIPVLDVELIHVVHLRLLVLKLVNNALERIGNSMLGFLSLVEVMTRMVCDRLFLTLLGHCRLATLGPFPYVLTCSFETLCDHFHLRLRVLSALILFDEVLLLDPEVVDLLLDLAEIRYVQRLAGADFGQELGLVLAFGALV